MSAPLARRFALLALLQAAPFGAGCVEPPAPPPLEPVEVEARIPLPPNIAIGTPSNQLGLSFGGALAPDARHVMLRLTVGGADHVGIMDLDGSDVRCLTCDVLPSATRGTPFEDGRRLWVGIVESGIGDYQWSVVECAPSLYDCQQKEAVPVRFPIPSLLDGAQNREALPHPDGRHIKWNEVRFHEGEVMMIGRLERRAAEYAVVDPLVLNPAFSLSDDPDDWVAGGRYYELGEWFDGGRSIKYGTTTTAANYDTWELDLATGARRQLTTDLDYNELFDASPDGRWLAYASPRGLDRMDVFSQLVRPPYLEMVSFPQLGRVGLWNNRRCMNERWLMDREGQRGAYAGQPVVIEDDWAIRSWSWFPDGTRALVGEQRLPNRPDPPAVADRVRLTILRFPARTPSAPLPDVELDDLDLSWAVPYGQYVGLAAQPVAGKRLAGRHSGEAVLDFTGTFAAGTWQVRYDRYSDDGRSFVSGTESLTTPLPILLATWSADLTLSGAQTGFLRGSLDVSGPGRFTGQVESEVDGVRFDRVPVQADCPGVRRPPLVLENVVARPVTARWILVTAEVRAELPETPGRWPVRHALVEVAGVRDRTDDRGRAMLLVPAGAGPSLAVHASAGSFVPATASVDATR